MEILSHSIWSTKNNSDYNSNILNILYMVKSALPEFLELASIRNQIKQRLPDFPDSNNLMNEIEYLFCFEHFQDYYHMTVYNNEEIKYISIQKAISSVNSFFDQYFSKKGINVYDYPVIEEYKKCFLEYILSLAKKANHFDIKHLKYRSCKRKVRKFVKAII